MKDKSFQTIVKDKSFSLLITGLVYDDLSVIFKRFDHVTNRGF